MNTHQPNLSPASGNEAQALQPANADGVPGQSELICLPESLASTGQTLGEHGLRAAVALSLDSRPTAELPGPQKARTRPTAQEQAASPFSALIAVRAELRALEAATNRATAKEREIVCDLIAAGLSPDQIAAAVNLTLAEIEHVAPNEAAAQMPKQETKQRSAQTTEPIDLMEQAPYVPHMHEQVYDHRPEFLGRVGTVTGFYPSKENPMMIYVRPIDFDGEHQAEWNARPCDVSPEPPAPPESA